jgi:hypothetical protein
MLMIEKNSGECLVRLRLRGRIESAHIGCIRAEMNDGRAHGILDLSEVTLVDVAVVQFLIRCEKEGVELLQCPPYVREWILRERAEGAESEPCNGN